MKKPITQTPHRSNNDNFSGVTTPIFESYFLHFEMRGYI